MGRGGADTLDGGAGFDVANYSLSGAAVTVSLAVAGPQDTGGEGVDTLISIEDLVGSNSGDVLTGNAAGNQLAGLDGNDTLAGGAGNDLLTGGVGNDSLNGGAGVDTASFSGLTAVNVSLLIQGPQNTGQGLDTLVDVENLTGSNGHDTLIGNGLANVLTGGGGMDTLIGGKGDDTYGVDNALDVVIELAGEGTDTVSSTVTWTLADNFENLTLTGTGATEGTGNGANNRVIGNASANTLRGEGGVDYVDGGAGADTLYGGDGNDSVIGGTGADLLIGGTGSDIYFVDDVNDVILEDAGSGSDLVATTVNYTLGANLEFLQLIAGGLGTDITGNELNNVLTGNHLANRLAGAAGNDTLNAGDGADTLIGGEGDDVLNGGNSRDTMLGGAGNDAYLVQDANDLVIELAGEGVDQVQSTIDYALTANVENLILTGTRAADGTGNELDNIIVGNNAANVLDGGAGADTLQGGLGNDQYVVDNAGDVVLESAAAGTDSVSSSVSFTLSDNVENLTLTGAADVDGTGNALDNVITGNGGANVLDGGAGAETLEGGDGDDTYVVDQAADVLREEENKGRDTVRSAISFTLAAAFENLVLTGTAAAGTGNAGANEITGNASANQLFGEAGDDRLFGGEGDDTLDGGAGADAMTGGAGNDRYLVNDLGDLVVEAASEGVDHVEASISYTLTAEVENLTLTGAAVAGTGNALNNVITGNAAANHLKGGDGADLLIGGEGNDTLDGGAGNDTLDGGAGDDRLDGGAGNDRLAGGDGFDKLYGGAGDDLVVVTGGPATPGAKNGLSVDVVFDFDQLGNDQLVFQGAKILGWEVFGNVHAAEMNLGIDLDGLDKQAADKAHTTVVYGDSNGDGIADFAVALIGVKTFTDADMWVG